MTQCGCMQPVHIYAMYTAWGATSRSLTEWWRIFLRMLACPKCIPINRATSITALSNAGFEARHMTVSGYRNETSVRSYLKDTTSDQKRSMSATISKLTTYEPVDLFNDGLDNMLCKVNTVLTMLRLKHCKLFDLFSLIVAL